MTDKTDKGPRTLKLARGQVAVLEISDRFEPTPTALVPRGAPAFEAWEMTGRGLGMVEVASQWWVGDWINYGDEHFGERAAQAWNDTGLQPGTLQQYAWVAKNVVPGNRVQGLSFWHHREVADLPGDTQQRWLRKAVEGDDGVPWTVERLRRELRASKDPEKAAESLWLVVEARDPADLDALRARMTAEGRKVKGRTKA